MKIVIAIVAALLCGCATARIPSGNPLRNVTPDQIGDILVGRWHVEYDQFPTPLLTNFRVFADVTTRSDSDSSIVSNLCSLVRQTQPWETDESSCGEFIPISYVMLKAGFVTEHPTNWLGEVTIYGDGELIHITDSPVNPKIDFRGRNRALAHALFRVVLAKEPGELTRMKMWLQEKKAQQLLNAYPFSEVPDEKMGEQVLPPVSETRGTPAAYAPVAPGIPER